jgi:protein-disulfide isomerase
MSNTNKSAQAPDPGSKRQQLRIAQERAAKEKRIRNVISYVVTGVLGLALIGGIVWSVLAFGSAAKKPVASTLNTTYSVLLGKTDAPVTLDIYQDFICPVCGEFEHANGADLTALVNSGQAALRIHPVNFLDASSLGTKYSTRAANAFITVAKAEPDKALAFNTALFDNQPAEKTAGLTDAKIAELAKQAGVSQATIDTFANLTYAQFSSSSWDAAMADGIDGTPTVFINGAAFSGNLYTAGPLKAAVESAANSR